MKVGDLVNVDCKETSEAGRIGIVTDVFEWFDERSNHCMYEIEFSDPEDRGWYKPSDIRLVPSEVQHV